MTETPTARDNEPRWPATAAVAVIVALHFGLPSQLRPYPEWILVSLCTFSLVLVMIAHQIGRHELNQVLGYAMNTVLSVFMAIGVVRLVQAILWEPHLEGAEILPSAGLLWASNILVFAMWYWRIDAGGPNARDKRERHEVDAFLFPQTTMKDHRWNPDFVDYLFLAFNTSTALSPTDTSALTRQAKILMMIQASVSLVIIVLLAARAVNTLQ